MITTIQGPTTNGSISGIAFLGKNQLSGCGRCPIPRFIRQDHWNILDLIDLILSLSEDQSCRHRINGTLVGTEYIEYVLYVSIRIHTVVVLISM